MDFTFTLWDGNDEVEHKLPGRKEVCPKCEGSGYHLTPSIGDHAYSSEEFDEAFEPGSEERENYFRRGGIYDVKCETCQGTNVVDVVDAEACTTPEQKALLQRYREHLREESAYRAEEAAERRMGC
jgi:RecJ-like exonuclease